MNAFRASLPLFLSAIGACAHAQAPGDILEVSIQRTACFGSCPIYDMALTRSGSARYNGVQWSARIGHFLAPVDSATFSRVAGVALENGFLAMDTAYVVPVTDLPTTITCLRWATGSHCVRRYGWTAPPGLIAIENAIDSASAGLKWASAPR